MLFGVFEMVSLSAMEYVPQVGWQEQAAPYGNAILVQNFVYKYPYSSQELAGRCPIDVEDLLIIVVWILAPEGVLR